MIKDWTIIARQESSIENSINFNYSCRIIFFGGGKINVDERINICKKRACFKKLLISFQKGKFATKF